MTIVTRIDFGQVQERSYFRTFAHPGGFTHHEWVTDRRLAQKFNNSKEALNVVSQHVPERNQHKVETVAI